MLTPADLDQLRAHGLSQPEAERQLALLASPPPPTKLARACTVGDGIRRLEGAAQAVTEARGAAYLASVRSTKFVPASGAATRMFKDVLAALDSKDVAPSKAVTDLLTPAARFAFFSKWMAALGVTDETTFHATDWRKSLEALLHEPGLDYARTPKAFIDFHSVDGHARTSMEEHWHEAIALHLKQLHFTISTEHEDGFKALVRGLFPLFSKHAPPTHSFQDPATDTIAGDGAGGPFRDDEGRLLLRPGGHGALIHNLRRLADTTDVAIIKNIDNIAHPRLWPVSLRWKRILAGVLAEELDAGWDRPVRVCGVVRNTGEPGGGPFFVEGNAEPQIVESAQVDLADPAQKAAFQGATHFNPVDLVCRLTDSQGIPFDLDTFVDPSTVFMSKKTHLGRPLVALERPGLWNGAMAHWKTVFVEVPLETFNPVKTILDLLKSPHQPG